MFNREFLVLRNITIFKASFFLRINLKRAKIEKENLREVYLWSTKIVVNSLKNLEMSKNLIKVYF